MKKFLIYIFTGIFLFFVSFENVFATNPVNIYLFYGETCPVCKVEKKFLEELKVKYDNVVIYKYEVWNNEDNRLLMVETGKMFNWDLESSVPFTVVGEKAYYGYTDQVAYKIEGAVETYSQNGYRDKAGVLLGVLEDEIVGELTSSEEVSNILDEKVEKLEKKAKEEKFLNQILIPCVVFVSFTLLCGLVIFLISEWSKKNGKISRDRT